MSVRHLTIQLTTFKRHETTMEVNRELDSLCLRRELGSLCLRPMNPWNQHVKASERTLSSGGSQIWARKGRDFISFQHYLTLTPKCCRSVTTNTFPLTWKDEGHTFLSMEFESFYMEHTQGEVNHVDGQVPKPSVLDDLLGVSSTSMDVDPSSVNGETELNAYMRVQQVTLKSASFLTWPQGKSDSSVVGVDPSAPYFSSLL